MKLTTPLTEEIVAQLRAGDKVSITGTIYVARDAAHKRMVAALDAGESLPFDPQGQIIYYMGPSPAKPGEPIGSAGPTTSGRMDRFTPALLERGMVAAIGKGPRSGEVRRAFLEHGAVYLVAVGGAAALLGGCVREMEVVAYPELGAEAVHRLLLEDLPAVVAYDLEGGNLFAGRREG